MSNTTDEARAFCESVNRFPPDHVYLLMAAFHEMKMPKWIPVMLGAEPHDPVWVTHGFWGEVSLAYFAHGIRKWYTRADDELLTDVIAYMPIPEPEPYTGEQK